MTVAVEREVEDWSREESQNNVGTSEIQYRGMYKEINIEEHTWITNKVY